jgi:hypothetical protein
MSGRTKHGRGRGSFWSKKKRSERGSHQVADVRLQAAAQKDKPVAATAGAVAVAPDTPKIIPATFNYPNILFELRNVLILFGVTLAALITVALIIR